MDAEPTKIWSIREATNDDAARIRKIVTTVLGEYGLKADPFGTDRDLDDIESYYGGAGGTFRVVESAVGSIVGCGGLYRMGPDEMELRKMYLLPEVRGRGLGKRMLDELIEFARQAGASCITLETAGVLREAIGLYERYGFVRVPRPDLATRCDQGWELRLPRPQAAP